MLNHCGTKKLETERLVLRKFTKEDASDMYKNWAADPEVAIYLTWLPHDSVETVVGVVDSWIKSYENEDSYHWAIELKETGEAIGSIGLTVNENLESCEAGYCIGRKFWGRGIMSESFMAVIDFAFTEVGFQRIFARHHAKNAASGKVMEKCGLKYEGLFRKGCKNNKGILVDCKQYSILKEEYAL